RARRSVRPRATPAASAPRSRSLRTLRTWPLQPPPRRGRRRGRAAAASRSAIPQVDDETSRLVERTDAEVHALLDADRPREDGLEIPGAHELAHDRGARVGAFDPPWAHVDEAPLVGREVEARCRLHPHEQDRAACDLDRVPGAVLDDRPVDVLDLPAWSQVLELEDDAVVAFMSPDGDAFEERRSGLLGGG